MEGAGKWFGPLSIERWMGEMCPKVDHGYKLESLGIKSLAFTELEETGFAKCVNARLGGSLANHGVICQDSRACYKGVETIDDPGFVVQNIPGVSLLLRETGRIVHDEAGLRHLLSDVVLFGELRLRRAGDPCLRITSTEDRLKLGELEFDADDSESLDTRRYILSYARGISMNSPRTHLFAFVIVRDYARLLYMDHSGVIYSELFKWCETAYLGDLIQCCAFARDSHRGIDTSAVRIAHDDALVKEAKKIFKQAREDDVLPDEVTWNSTFPSNHRIFNNNNTYWLFDVYDAPSNSFHQVLAYRPNMSHPYFVGRATCGYIAVDLTERAVAYMKRSWRLAGGPIERETYLELERVENGGSVPHLPGCYFGGDVPEDASIHAMDYFKWEETASDGESWPAKYGITSVRTRASDFAECNRDIMRREGVDVDDVPKDRHILTVTLFRRVGTALSNFKSTRQLCLALRDAMQAHEGAYRLKHILHRDISEGNILIAKVPGRKGETEGLLIDWDFCTKMKEELSRSYQTGTRPFMSLRVLKHEDIFLHDIRDDLESFCHVLHFVVLCNIHTLAPEQMSRLMDDVVFITFSPAKRDSNVQAREDYLRDDARAHMKMALDAVAPAALSKLMSELRGLFGAAYEQPPDSPSGLPSDATEEEREDRLEEMVLEHSRRVTRAEHNLTYGKVLKRFNDQLADKKGWLSNDRAQNQFPQHIRQARRINGPVEKYYRETQGMFFVMTSREVARLEARRKRQAEELDVVADSEPPHGSDADLDLVASDSTFASDEAVEGARKRQRLVSEEV
ncbi:unnamed protein product [Peniophora sp. CBMAI 1063]|nr:unnamed protein product [Peniophora sp. CBMAI 1063]